jgi:SAM-dependent methyltransferase
VTEFEGRVFNQTKVGAADYDEGYFTNNWREGDNCYTLESRRKIEGRHPEVIKEVFSPSKVLDMGCGPGVLMFLLHEVGIVADGIDHSPDVVAIAPAEVRERIMVGSAGDHLVAEDSYDLVICREVFEHLTVLQVREAVRNICRISSKYVYITTRFHPNPSNLLDVTTQFEVDPTHITLLNKDFLRLLFVLEGFHCRPDLESRIDWMNKGRALVYEKEND